MREEDEDHEAAGHLVGSRARRCRRWRPPAAGSSSADRRACLTTTATQAAAKPTMPISQPRMACQPAVSSTGGRRTSPEAAAWAASLRTAATSAGPAGTTMSRPMANRPPMMARLAATGERSRAARTARATPEQAGDGGVDPGVDADEDPAGHDGGGQGREGHGHGQADRAIVPGPPRRRRSRKPRGRPRRGPPPRPGARAPPAQGLELGGRHSAPGPDAVGQGGGEVLAGVDADHLAAEAGGDAHGVGVLVVPQEGHDEDGHAGVEQEPQLGGLQGPEPGRDEDVVGVPAVVGHQAHDHFGEGLAVQLQAGQGVEQHELGPGAPQGTDQRAAVGLALQLVAVAEVADPERGGGPDAGLEALRERPRRRGSASPGRCRG